MRIFAFVFQERARILLRFADLIEKHNDEIATLETWDNGKPYEQASKIEVPMVARLFRYYAGEQMKRTLQNYFTLHALKNTLCSDIVCNTHDCFLLNIV